MTNKSACWGIDIGYPSCSPNRGDEGKDACPQFNMTNKGAGCFTDHPFPPWKPLACALFLLDIMVKIL